MCHSLHENSELIKLLQASPKCQMLTLLDSNKKKKNIFIYLFWWREVYAVFSFENELYFPIGIVLALSQDNFFTQK